MATDVIEDDDEESPLAAVAAGAVTFLTLAVAFGLLFAGSSFFWVAFPVGFGGALPLAVALAKYYESRQAGRGAADATGTDRDEALAALRERYANGELSEAEFERRVERLLETESVDDAATFAERAGSEDAETDGESAERERERA